MMIEQFQTPENLFEFRRIVFLILQECLDHKVVDAVIHMNRHNREYISIQFSDAVREGKATRGYRNMPDVDLLFLPPEEHKLYREFREARVQAAMDADDDAEDD